MNLSNYPPGVTGHEPEIAGWDEHVIECEDCGREVVGYGQFRSAGRDGAYGDFSYDCGCGMSGSVFVCLERDEDYGRDR